MALAAQSHRSTGPPSDGPPSAGPPSASAEDRLRLLIETGLRLSCERKVEVIIQAALDAGLRLCGASFGACIYNHLGEDGELCQEYEVAAADSALLASLPLYIAPGAFSGLFPAQTPAAIQRFDDITQLPPGPQRAAFSSFSNFEPFPGMRAGHAAVHSLLAAPIQTPGGERLGALLFGDPTPNLFDSGCEELVATISSQAAVALDNARLTSTLSREIALADAARALQRDTATRLAQVFEAITDGVLLLDRNWRFTYFNRRAREIIAQGPNRDRNLVGLHFLELFPESAGSVFQQRYAETMNQGRSVEFTDFSIPLGLWIEVRAFPMADGIAIFFQDITQQRRDEQALADSSRRLRQALDAAQLGTWSWDRASDLLDLDERAAELLHVEPHATVTRTALRERVVVADDVPATLKDLQRALSSGGLYSSEYRVDDHATPVTWVSSSGIATFSPGSPEITGMVGTLQDITTRKNSEAALRQGEKLAATGRLAATIAHEINNPLEAVTNLIYLCKTDPNVPDAVKSLLNTADHELARVAQIAQQTLGFYRDSGRPVEIDINELLQSSADLFARRMQSRKIACTLDLAPNMRIVGLPGEIRQVVSNLLVNAMDASVGSGLIHIRGRQRSRHSRQGVSLLVCDRGSGIPANARARLFSPFFTTKESVGTGLGLWVTRGIVEKQGGSIRFRTRTEPPSGTVFRVFLPAKIEMSANRQTTPLTTP